MTTQQIEKNFQEIWALFKETDKKFKETDQAIRSLTGKWGRFVEGLIVPAVKRLFKARDIEVEKVYQRVKAHKNGKEMEVDILAIDEVYAILIEAKSTLSVEDVMEHLDRLANFKMFFPEYDKKKIIGAVAGIVIDEGADRYAYHQGLFVIAQSGETVKILNDKKFRPKMW